MTEQFWTQLLATAVGGMIAAIAGVVTIRYGKKLDREDKRTFLIIDAYAEWAKSMEETLSHYDNFHRLAAQHTPAALDGETKGHWSNEIIRVSILAGDAGRRLDSARYRILLFEKRQSFRDEVSRITEASMMWELKESPVAARSSQYSVYAKQIREDLSTLLRDFAAADGLG